MLPFPKPAPAAAPSGSAHAPGEFADRLALGPDNAPRSGGDARDGILRALAQRFYPGVPVSTQAARLHLLAAAYAIANWPGDRTRPQCPLHYRGTPDEYLWAAFKTGAPMPIAARDLRRILLGIGDED